MKQTQIQRIHERFDTIENQTLLIFIFCAVSLILLLFGLIFMNLKLDDLHEERIEELQESEPVKGYHAYINFTYDNTVLDPGKNYEIYNINWITMEGYVREVKK